MCAACLFHPPDNWLNAGWLLVFQPARVLGYAAYFALGFHALGKNWFAKNRPAPRKRNWLAAAVVSGFIWLAVKAAFPSPHNSWQCLLYAVGQNTFCLTFFMSIFNWGTARNKRHTPPLLPALAKSSFAIYLWHLPVIILLAPAVFAAHLPAALQFLLLAFAGIGIPAGLAKAAGK